jgi:hypothetical protein
MAKTPKLRVTSKIQVPFFVIAYGPKKLFSLDNEAGSSTLPIFTEGEAAELYRRHFAKSFKLKLQVFVVDKIEKALNLIECASLACPSLQHVVVNPFLPSPNITQPKLKAISTVIANLKAQYRRQKGHNHQNPRKK